jgi:hypothetical protein
MTFFNVNFLPQEREILVKFKLEKKNPIFFFGKKIKLYDREEKVERNKH